MVSRDREAPKRPGLETRVYDRYALPPSVHRIWHIIAFPGMAMTTLPTTQTEMSGIK